MAVTNRAADVIGGPRGGTVWQDNGESYTLPATTAAVTAVHLPVQIITRPCVVVPTSISTSVANADVLATDNWIQSIFGGAIVFNANLAAQSTLSLTVSVYRAGVVVGGGPAWGWLAAGAGTPAFTALVPVALPLVAANTALVANGIGGPLSSFIPVQPNDVITLDLQTSSSTVAVTAGSLNLLVN